MKCRRNEVDACIKREIATSLTGSWIRVKFRAPSPRIRREFNIDTCVCRKGRVQARGFSNVSS